MKLDVKALGLALGILWGGACLLMGLLAMLGPWAQPWVDAIGQFYIGYDATAVGSLVGGVWGFFDAGIGGVVLAWLYNKLAK